MELPVPRDGADQPPQRSEPRSAILHLVVVGLVTRSIADLPHYFQPYPWRSTYKVVVEPERMPARFVSSGKD